jgi:hypothetical protein
MKMLKNKFRTYQEVHLAEASSLVWLYFKKSNFYPFKLDQWIYGLVLLVFWYFCSMFPKRGAKRRERHFQKILGSEASQNHLLYIYIYIYIYIYNFIYIAFILKKKKKKKKKHAERQISCRMYENIHVCTL